MEAQYILAINPGATSTKIAVYMANSFVFLKSIRHESGELEGFNHITEQLDYRMDLVIKEMEENHIPADQVRLILARGGLLHPIESGVYEVNETMIKDLMQGVMGEHASNLGGLIASKLTKKYKGAKAYIADPVVVDEMDDVARISGHPAFTRKSIFHALNQKAIARSYAQSRGVEYEDLNLIVAHLGSGISVGAHRKGRVVDVNNGLNGEGPFGPERSGTLPAGALSDLCFSAEKTPEEVRKMLLGEGGMYAYLGYKEADRMAKAAREGDAKAKLIQEAMGYQIAKEIGSLAAVMGGEVHAIIMTGGIAHNPDLTAYVKERVSFIAPVFVYPGEDEMKALAINGSLLLSGKISAKTYGHDMIVKGLDIN